MNTSRQPAPDRRTMKRAFTLVELLVVIGIIAVLIGILLPVLGKAREQANRVACASNLRQVALAVFMYENTNHVLPGPLVPMALDPVIVNANPSILEKAYQGLPAYWTKARVISNDDLVQKYLKSNDVWYCPSNSNTRLTATPARTQAYTTVLGYCYKINNQSTNWPPFTFGYWFTTAQNSTTTLDDQKPKKLSVRRGWYNGSKYVKLNASEHWMMCDIDGPVFPVSAATWFGLVEQPPTDASGNLRWETTKYQPGHKAGVKRGRTWVFFDGHAEYLQSDFSPADP